MRKNKKLAVICVALGAILSITCLAGCGSSGDTSGTAEVDSSTTVAGIVKNVDVDNNTVTISELPLNEDMGNGQQPPTGADGEKMEPPTGSNGDKPEPPTGSDGEKMEPPTGANGEKPEMPDGQEPPTGSDGEMPEMPSMEEKTYTISDGVVIKNGEGKEVGIKDISVGELITLEGVK